MLKRYLAQDLTVERRKKNYCGLLSMHRTSDVMVLI